MRCPPWLVKALRILLLVCAGFIALIVALLFAGQRTLIYHPIRYQNAERAWAKRHYTLIHYNTAAGPQTAYYMPPRDKIRAPLGKEEDATGSQTQELALNERPSRVWALIAGNAATAMDWEDFALSFPGRSAAFLLIDYPGYGANAGSPTRAAIVEAMPAAVEAARRAIPALRGEKGGAAAPPLGVMGHSLGCAAALELAARSNADRIVLNAPFTDLMAMARRTVGWPLCLLLRDRFDNAARLKELARRSPRPAVTILHGEQDALIPIAMGRALAAAHPGWINFKAIPNADHNGILKAGRGAMAEAMLASGAAAAKTK